MKRFGDLDIPKESIFGKPFSFADKIPSSSFGLPPFVPDEKITSRISTLPSLSLCKTHCDEEDSIECDPIICQWLNDSFDYYTKLNQNQKQLISQYISGLSDMHIYNDYTNGTISKNIEFPNLQKYIEIYSIIKGAPVVPKDIYVTRHVKISDERSTLSCDKTHLPPKDLPHIKPIATSIEKAFPIRFSLYKENPLSCCFLNIQLKKGTHAFFLGPPSNYKKEHLYKTINILIQYEVVLLPSIIHITNYKKPDLITINDEYLIGLNKHYKKEVLDKFNNIQFNQYNCTIKPLEIEILWNNHTHIGIIYDLKHICSSEEKKLIKLQKKENTYFNLYHKSAPLFQSIENYSKEFSLVNKDFVSIIYKEHTDNNKVRIYKDILQEDYTLSYSISPLIINNKQIQFSQVIGFVYQQFNGGKNIRPSPEIHAADTPLGTVRKGNNSYYWIVLENIKKVHRWVELGIKFKQYDCLYNGETNKVFIGDTSIYIFTTIEKSITKLAYTISKYTKYWISKASWVVPSKKKGYKGSTILVEIKPKHYIYIDGRIVKSFNTDSPILKYDSPMGNSFVPYGYAITTNKTYLMLESVWVEWNGKGDPYEHIYNKQTNGTKFATKILFDAWKNKS